MDEEIARLAGQYKMEEDKVRSVVNVDDIRRDLGMRSALDLVKAAVKKTAKKAEKGEEKAEKKAAKKTEKAARRRRTTGRRRPPPKRKPRPRPRRPRRSKTLSTFLGVGGNNGGRGMGIIASAGGKFRFPPRKGEYR